MLSFEDVIGPVPVKEEPKEFGWRDPEEQQRQMLTAKDAQALFGGVNVTTLGHIFNKSTEFVKTAMRSVQPIGHSNSGHPYYDIAEAAEYLVVGKRDLASILKNLAPEDLPDNLRTAFWDAKLKEQKFKENAKELWRTEQVMECIGVMFSTVKSTTQLFMETINRASALDDKQRETLSLLITSMMDECREALKENVKASKTRCTLKDIDDV